MQECLKDCFSEHIGWFSNFYQIHPSKDLHIKVVCVPWSFQIVLNLCQPSIGSIQRLGHKHAISSLNKDTELLPLSKLTWLGLELGQVNKTLFQYGSQVSSVCMNVYLII